MPVPAMKEYSSNEVNISLAGFSIDGGFADGVFLELEFQNPAFALTKGTDGEGTRSRSNDRSALVRIHLMQGANANAVLTALHQLDLNVENGVGVGSLDVTDKNGTTVYFALHAWVAEPPNPTYDRTATERVWTLMVNHLELLEGAY